MSMQQNVPQEPDMLLLLGHWPPLSTPDAHSPGAQQAVMQTLVCGLVQGSQPRTIGASFRCGMSLSSTHESHVKPSALAQDDIQNLKL